MVRRNTKGYRTVSLVAGWLMLAGILAACGQDSRPTPDYSNVMSAPAGPDATVTPPFLAATNITPEATDTPVPPGQPTPTETLVPNTPIVKPTPDVPSSAVLTSDDLGTGTWSDTEVLWAATGDIFVLHVMREGDDSDFYYLVRPPDSIQSSFRWPRAVYGTLSWSPDGRYLLYIDKSTDASGGAVKLIDLQRDPTQERKLIAGPCTGAAWLPDDQIVATCGLAIYQISAEPTTDPPTVLFKLENNQFSGTDIDLSLLFQALPSPDGKTLAIFGVRKQSGPIPLGDIAFYNLDSKRLSILDRNNRPVTMVNWTPDGKYLVLRNLTGDWAVPYTFDYYLADPAKQKIIQNLTKSNDKCDPVLGAKPDCQGQSPSSIQSNDVIFSPDGLRYFFTGQRWVARPNAALTTAERLSSTKLGSTTKPDQLIETAPGEKLVGLTWLPNGHYFYSVGFGTGTAKAVLDGKTLDIKGSQVTISTTKGSPTPTKKPASALTGFSLDEQDTAVPVTSPAATGPTAAPTLIISTPAPPTNTAGPTPVPPTDTPSGPPPTPTLTPVPRGTSLLGFDTVTAQAANQAFTPPPIQDPGLVTPQPTVALPQPSPTSAPLVVKSSPSTTTSPSAGAGSQYPRAAGYYISPTGNWIVAIERIADSDQIVQFQVRLIPFTLK